MCYFQNTYPKHQLMIDINIESPIIINFDTRGGLNCKISHKMFSEQRMGINLPVNYSLFMNLKDKNSDGKFILPMDSDKIFGKEIVSALTEIKTIIGKCTQLGEALNNKLSATSNRFKSDPILTSVFKKYNERYHKLDFMGHRNLLSDIIKSKKIDKITDLGNTYNLKSVTKAFNNFILDRNKYTHGDLMYWYPDGKTLLEYKDVNGEVEYGEINKDILNSYLKCYTDLDKFLDILNL